jgi:polynucleotide 5'-hydroxyl-kinase GRC3/NOL9
MGSILRPSKQVYRVFASSSHSLPVMRCLATDSESAELRLHSCDVGLESLESLSPLFGKLWNDNSGSYLSPEYTKLLPKTKRCTFQIVSSPFKTFIVFNTAKIEKLFTPNDGLEKAYLQPLISPPEWNEILANCSTTSGQSPRVIMVCGPKSSGKSTFVKFLVNRLLSTLTNTSRPKTRTKKLDIALLDIDPGQPEYSPPGQLSLIHVSEPNFGPPFTHPIPNAQSEVIRSHSIATISPSLDPSLYMACVLDLFAHYRNLLSTEPHWPLVINTPGWVLGTGLEILVEIITQLRPSEIIYMSQDGPSDVVDSLRDAAKSTPVLTLPSQGSEYTTRTAAHLRTMQSMSYFHLNSTRKSGLGWNGLPLTAIPPWEISYSGETPGLLGVICYGEQPLANLLADTINGSVVAIVVIDDVAAIPGWTSDGSNMESPTQPFDKADDTENRPFDRNSLQPQYLENPLIISTPDEGIPYFNPSNAISLDPRYSHSIGFALVRGIDVARRRLQVLTPIPPDVIEDVNQVGKSIVLISGKLDTPGWAYIEDLNRKTALDKAARKPDGRDLDVDDEGSSEFEAEASKSVDEAGNRRLSDGFQTALWVDRLEGSQGRGIGSRVWRVRRDLGKAGDGGN